MNGISLQHHIDDCPNTLERKRTNTDTELCLTLHRPNRHIATTVSVHWMLQSEALTHPGGSGHMALARSIGNGLKKQFLWPEMARKSSSHRNHQIIGSHSPKIWIQPPRNEQRRNCRKHWIGATWTGWSRSFRSCPSFASPKEMMTSAWHMMGPNVVQMTPCGFHPFHACH